MEYITGVSFAGTHGSAIYLQKYLSMMFQISDVLVDKDEVAMALHIKIDPSKEAVDNANTVPESNGSNMLSSVSNSYVGIILQKVGKILSAQGFPCVHCPWIEYKLLPLSVDCRGAVLPRRDIEQRFLLVIQCKDKQEIFRFEIDWKEASV